MTKLTWEQVAAWRVERQYLARRAPAGRMLAVASRLCGLHAQVLSCAELMAWARVEGLKRGTVQRALWEERTLVKTWAMRGTLHLLPSADLPVWHGALSTSRRYQRPALWRRFGLTMAEMDSLTKAIGTALDGRVFTREELAREVGRITGSAAFAKKLALGGWGTILKPAAFCGGLCFAPSVGQRVRFTRPSSWITTALPPMGIQTATAEVTRRFLTVYGPGTYHDLARWWGSGGLANARQWIATLREDVVPVDVKGEQAWMLAADAREALELPAIRSVRLLPAFDQYVIAASRHADHLLDGAPRSRVYRPQGWVSPVLLVNGMMQGVWRHEVQGSSVGLLIQPFVKLPAWVRRAAEEEAERLAAFFDSKLRLVWEK
jgi:Winged helix DNA-binding domain